MQNKLKKGKIWSEIDADQQKAILDNIDQYFAPSWASSKEFKKYHEIKEGDTVIAYTLQDSDYTWIYASAKKKAEPSQPAEPANLKTFYTSNGKKIDLVMKKDGSLDFDATKEKLQKLLVERADELVNIDENGKALKEIAEKFAEKATEKDVQIITIEGEDLLFVNLGTSTKVFFANENSIFKDAFKGGTAGKPDFDKDKIVAPQWTDPQKTLVKYNEVKKDGKLIGYTVKNDAFQWFYVPTDTTTPPPAVVTKKFYTSNNKEFAVIMKDNNTVDFEASKKLLADKLDSIANQKDKELAEDFVKNATDADVEIKRIEGIDILFVKTKDSTKAFAGTPDSIFKDAFKEGTAGKLDFDKDKIVAPQWTKTTKDVIKYNKVGDIGYTLKNSDNDWYFAPKAKPQNKPNNGGGSSGGGSSGGGSSYSGGGSSASSSASKVTPTKTTEVKGDETVRVFALTGAVNPTITTLDDARLDEFMKKNNIAVADKNIGMTRAEVVKLLAQVTGQKTDSVDVAKLQYVDVGKNTEYAKYIAFATENKIVSGYEDGTFRPNNIISRAELMKVLVNSIGYKLADKQTQFADVEATHTLALYIQTAYNNKIINGVTATTFEPNRAITKGEFAKIIYNILYTK